MPLDLPVQDAVALALEAYEPERYWALWQHPEGRYAYSVEFDRAAWLITLGSEELGYAALVSDARQNGRPLAAYRLDALSLPDAFDAARAQPVPFLTSFGLSAEKVLGVVLIAEENGSGASVRHFPL